MIFNGIRNQVSVSKILDVEMFFYPVGAKISLKKDKYLQTILPIFYDFLKMFYEFLIRSKNVLANAVK